MPFRCAGVVPMMEELAKEAAAMHDDDIMVGPVRRVAVDRAPAPAELVLHYQPLVRFDVSEVVGFEALLRWQHPELGLLGPDAALAGAHDAEQAAAIGAWVVRAACVQAARWADESVHDTPLCVAVNVSAAQLADPALVETVAAALASAGLNANQLVIEVPEVALAPDLERAVDVVRALGGIGVRTAIDAFGTGDTPLRALRSLPVASLKLHPSLVDGLGEEDDDAAAVAGLVALAHALGISVTAVGVETPRQLSELRSLGCDAAQGFYFARPQPAEVVRALVHRRCHWRTADTRV